MFCNDSDRPSSLSTQYSSRMAVLTRTNGRGTHPRFSSRGPVIAAGLLLFVFALLPGAAFGQSVFGTIAGNVTDASGAAIVGAKVVTTNPATSFVRDTTTNSAGIYTVPDVLPGTYTITITMAGFQTYTSTGVVVTVQAITRMDAALVIGGVSENVTVSAQAATLQTDRVDVVSDIGSQLLDNAPVPIGRNYQMLFTTLPGVSPPQSGHSFGANPTRSLAFTVNGGNIDNNDTRIDGAGTRNFGASDTIQYIPAMESIESVTMASNSYDADQSTGGSFVLVTVKNGTNTIHGSLFEDHADRDTAAYAWVANRTQPKLPYNNNQFGGTIGGPIKKNKLFYFGSYEGTRLVQGNSVQVEVPTVAMKAGNLSASPTAIYDPLTGAVNGSGRTPFAGNIIPTSRIDIGIQNLIGTGSYPNPNQAGTGAFGLGNDFLCNGCQGNSGARRDQLDAKVNWNPSAKLSTFARIGYNNGSWYNPQIFGLLGGPEVSPSNGAEGVGAAQVYNGTISATYVFNSSLFADAYFGYDRNNMWSHQPYQNENIGWTLLQIPGLSTAGLSPSLQAQQNGMPLMAIDGFGTLGPANEYQPQSYSDPEKNVDVSVNWQKGSHNFRAGFEADLQDANEAQYEVSGNSIMTNAGGFHFEQGTTQLLGGPAGNDFNAFASFLLGMPQDAGKIHLFPQANVPADQANLFSMRERSYSFYIRDRWQVSPKLTVNLGVRYDYDPFPRRAGNGVEVYNPYNANMYICGIGSTPGDCGITKDRQHVGPRVGLAYRVTDSTVIRSGYSLSTDPVFFEGHEQSGRENFPYLFDQDVSSPNSLSYATTLRQGIPTVSAPDLSTGVVPVPATAFLNTYNNANYARGYIQTWNLTLEQRMGNWLASAGYIGTRAIDSESNLQMNWAPINSGTAGEQLYQLTGRTASTLFMGTMGTNTYDGLQAHVKGHLGGFQVNASYAFSKAIGYADGSATPSGQVQIPSDWRLNRGLSSTDNTHMFSFVGIYELPFGAGKAFAQTGPVSKLAGGWQLSTVLVAHTGPPFTATASSASLNAPFSSQFADCLAPPQELGSILHWYSPSTFGVPSTGRFGTCGTANLFGPGLVNIDFGLERKFRLTERLQLSFRAEMFNAANTPHHVMTTTSVSSSTFLQAVSIANTGREGEEQRAARFALHLSF